MNTRTLGLTTSGSLIAATATLAGIMAGGCGKAVPLGKGDLVGKAFLDPGETRADGSGTGRIYEVTMLAAPTFGVPAGHSSTTDFPWNSPNGIQSAFVPTGQASPQDTAWPFYFNYSWPANNFKLTGASLLLDISRDTSDTEGLFFDGIQTGCGASVRNASIEIVHALHSTAGTTAQCAIDAGDTGTKNVAIMSYSMSHFKVGVRNTFNYDLNNQLTLSGETLNGLLSDGQAYFVTGDDLGVYQAALVMNGITIRREPPAPGTCTNSPTYGFQNVYLHNDGRTIGTATFQGDVYTDAGHGGVGTPTQSFASAGANFQSVEVYYDAPLPVPASKKDTVTLSTAKINFTAAGALKKTVTANNPAAAIVVNGRGVAEATFDTTKANLGVVTAWDTNNSTWSSFVSSVSTDGSVVVSLDLVALYGADVVRDMLAEGKLNIAIGGSLSFLKSSANTSTRNFAAPVNGAELQLAGTYFVELCPFENNPDSPLTSSTTDTSGLEDHTGPVFSSLGATDVTSSAATIVWLTDENATSQVKFCAGNGCTPVAGPAEDTDRVSFHSVRITGLQPYTPYVVEVSGSDGFGNAGAPKKFTFVTLR